MQDLLAQNIARGARAKAFALDYPPMAVRCDSLSDYNEWTAWTGVAPDYVHAFAYAGVAATWQTNFEWTKTQCETFAGLKLVWGMALSTTTQNLAQTYAGTHDATINAILEAMLAHNPVGPLYLRPGWEAGNLSADWPWMGNTGDRVNYIAAFQRVYTMAKAKSSRFVVGWGISANSYISGAIDDVTNNATGFYPGDAYVDYIGVDNYLVGSDISAGLDFDGLGQSANRLFIDNLPYGLHYLANFARARNKPMAIDEWGVGADRPDYIRDHGLWMKDPRNRVLYHGYWNKNADGQGAGGTAPYRFPCRLSDNSNDYPLSKAAFLNVFYGRGVQYTEQAMTTALLARSTSTVSDARRAAYDRLFRTLLINGLDAYIDCLLILAGQDTNITMLNAFGGGGFTTTTQRSTGRGSIAGSPTFVANKGFTGVAGSTGSYIATNGMNMFNAQNRKIAQNNAHFGIYSFTKFNPASQSGEAGVSSTFIGRNTSGNWVGRPNSSGTVTLASGDAAAGHIMWNKTSSTDWQSFLNGVAQRNQTNQAITSVAITSADLRLCATPDAGGANQLSFVHFGSALPTSFVNGPAIMSAAFLAFLQDIGAV